MAKKHYVCGNPESFGDGRAVYKLGTLKPTWYYDGNLPGLTRETVLSAIRTALSRWEAVCGLQFSEAANVLGAMWRITTANLGTSGILADAQLPAPGLTQQRIRINTKIRWGITDGRTGDTDIVRVLGHEGGHACGLVHWDPAPPPELMEPTYNPDIFLPQPAEARIMAGWYGPPVQPNPPPTPPGNLMTWIDGRSYKVTPVF